jgi:hypothetical protein
MWKCADCFPEAPKRFATRKMASVGAQRGLPQIFSLCCFLDTLEGSGDLSFSQKAQDASGARVCDNTATCRDADITDDCTIQNVRTINAQNCHESPNKCKTKNQQTNTKQKTNNNKRTFLSDR